MGKINKVFLRISKASLRVKLFFKKHQRWAIPLGIFGVIVNIIFFQSINSQALAILMIYWLIMGAVYKINEKFFFTLALICLVLTVPPFLLNNMVLAERFSVWEFLFIVLALWQWLYSELKDKISKK